MGPPVLVIQLARLSSWLMKWHSGFRSANYQQFTGPVASTQPALPAKTVANSHDQGGQA